MNENIVEYKIRGDKEGVEETLKFKSGIVISRKVQTDLFDFILQEASTYAGVPISIGFKEKLEEGGIVSKETADLLSQDKGQLPLGGLAIQRGSEFMNGNYHSENDMERIIPLDEITMWKGDMGLERRKCFHCQKQIGYGDFWSRNHGKMSDETLENIWKSPYVQLYCCTCFSKKGLFEKLAKKNERLLNKAYKLNEKFGFLVD